MPCEFEARSMTVTLMALIVFLAAPSLADEPPATVPPDRGIVEGRITYDGPLPDPVLNSEAGTRRRPVEVDPNTKGLRDAAVWLEGVPESNANDEAPADREPIEIDQRNYTFIPHVVTVEAGRPVAFLNNDVANHGVTASSRRPENRFNILTPLGGRYVHRFQETRQPVAIGCPIHASMSAWVFVFDHPYHTVTDDSGRFRLPPAPPGRYRLWAHHPDGRMRSSVEVVVAAGASTPVRIDFHADDLAIDDDRR